MRVYTFSCLLSHANAIIILTDITNYQLFPHSPSVPRKIPSPCPRCGNTYSRLSFTAFGLPGRLTIRDLPRIPAVPLVSIALFLVRVIKRRIDSPIPGISLSTTAYVASGTQSSSLHPIPPIVRIRSAICASAIFARILRITSLSFGTGCTSSVLKLT